MPSTHRPFRASSSTRDKRLAPSRSSSSSGAGRQSAEPGCPQIRSPTRGHATMSAFARSKRPATLSRLRRGDRVVAVIATVIAPVLVWLVATFGFGQHLYQPGFGDSAPRELSIWLVAAVAGIAALAGVGVLALVERINRRPAPVWVVGSTA